MIKKPVLLHTVERIDYKSELAFVRTAVPGGWLYTDSRDSIFVRDSGIRVIEGQREYLEAYANYQIESSNIRQKQVTNEPARA